jgi:quercetin dioxygenase-like cupin family protein
MFYGGEAHLNAQPETPSRTGELVMSQESMPLVPLEKGVFPDEGYVHRGGSAAVFMWPVDLPHVNHKANSILARMAVLKYVPGGSADARTFPDIREQAFFVAAGRARFTLDHSMREAGPGDLVFVPSGIEHAYEAVGKTPLKMVLMEWRSGDISKSRSLGVTVVSERLKPLTRLSAQDAGNHYGISASPFVSSRDYTTLSHKANSSLAWIGLQQYDADPSITATPVHSHATSEQAFYLLEGRAQFVVGDNEQEVGPGELVFAPRHVRHGYKVIGAIPVKWLMMGWSSQ